MERILYKQIFKVHFTLASALAIQKGESFSMGSDILLGSDGRPIIPGTSICGACADALGREKYPDLWGNIHIDTEDGDNTVVNSSRLIFYDAVIDENSDYSIVSRGGVSVDEYKTAYNGVVYVVEALESGAKFTAFFEQSFFSYDEHELGKDIADSFLTNNVYFGSRTKRGFGAICDATVEAIEVHFDKGEVKSGLLECPLNMWIEKGIFDKDICWGEYKNEVAIHRKQIELEFELQGGISVKQYTTNVVGEDNERMPDYTQIMVNESGEDKPLIPGTTWSGAIIHHVRRIVRDNLKQDEINYDEDMLDVYLGKAFGYTKDGRSYRAKVSFGDSLVEGSQMKKMFQNPIDRFLGTGKGMFTEFLYYGGTTVLKISFDDGYEMDRLLAHALAATLTDIHMGIASIGGATSYGKGICKIIKINNRDVVDITDDVTAIYNKIYELIPVGAVVVR